MTLERLREKIDEIDAVLLKAFIERMEVSKEIGAAKLKEGKPIFDAKREREKILDIASNVPEHLKTYACSLYDLIFDLSKSYQNQTTLANAEILQKITNAIKLTPKTLPDGMTVACQGVLGAYSGEAAQSLFKRAKLKFYPTFESVFNAIECDECNYAVLPLENSTAGSVTRVYDLMQKHSFYIAESKRLKIDHSLLTNNPNAKLSDIKEIMSHEQAISQCGEFLSKLGADVKITRVENTAVAAQIVMMSQRPDVAAISSNACAELYGLNEIMGSIQDQSNNYTRFICISKNLEIYPGANRTSVMLTLPHKPGSLYKALGRLYALGANLIKLESRPIPRRDFEFTFYFDLETSVYSPEFPQIITNLKEVSDSFVYLGSYLER